MNDVDSYIDEQLKNCPEDYSKWLFENDIEYVLNSEKDMLKSLKRALKTGKTKYSDSYLRNQIEFRQAVIDRLNKRLAHINVKEGNKTMKKKNENMNLQEATIKALYNELDDDREIRDVEGVVDDVLVITDPEITKDEYEEVIERAQEIVDDTPEGDIPFDEDYIGQYLQTCPICGSSFVEDHLLEPRSYLPYMFRPTRSICCSR